jgi:hypothetical protein
MFSTQLAGETDDRELVPVGPMDAQRRAQLSERIDGLQPSGGTGLYDTALAAYQFVRGRGRRLDSGGGLHIGPDQRNHVMDEPSDT